MEFIITFFRDLAKFAPESGGETEGEEGEIDEEDARIGGGEREKKARELAEEVHEPEMEGKEKVGELVSVHVIPRPHAEVDSVLPHGKGEYDGQ